MGKNLLEDFTGPISEISRPWLKNTVFALWLPVVVLFGTIIGAIEGAIEIVKAFYKTVY